jgi:hypothetical protein
LIEPEALAGARGAVRDGVACIENLAQLLGSRRVGPRQLPHALPEVQAGCVALVAALAALDAAMADQLTDDPEGLAAVKAMLEHAADRARELGATLKGREKAPIEARERLSLEATVCRIAGELNTVLRLTDLISAAATAKTTAIDLGDVLAQRRPSLRSMLTPVLAVIELRTSPALVADARVVLELLEFAVATVVRAGIESPRIVADRGADEALVITVGAPAPAPALAAGAPPVQAPRVVDVSLRAALPQEADVVRAAARRAGISLEIGADGRAVKLVI